MATLLRPRLLPLQPQQPRLLPQRWSRLVHLLAVAQAPNLLTRLHPGPMGRWMLLDE